MRKTTSLAYSCKRVVDRRHEVGLRAVVVDAQAAADVEVLDAGPDAEHLHVNPGRFGQGRLDVADVGDLAADVEVHELKAIGHVALLEILEGFQDLGQGQAELGSKAGARLPPARAAGRELDPHADRRPDVQLLAVANDRLELGELLDDRDHLLADLAGEHGHLDELIVLEAVADDRRIGRFGQGEHGQELGLRAGLDPEMVGLAKIEDLLDDMPLLVHLDRVDAAITPLVLVLADGGAEGVVDLADAMAEDVREAKQDRQLDAALLELIDQFLEVDRLAGVLVGMNRHVPLGIDPEVVLAPVANAVRFQGIIDLPRIGESMFRALHHSRALLFPLMDKRRVSRSLAVRSTSIFQILETAFRKCAASTCLVELRGSAHAESDSRAVRLRMAACMASAPVPLLPQQFQRALDEGGRRLDGLGGRHLEPLHLLELAQMLGIELAGADVESIAGE